MLSEQGHTDIPVYPSAKIYRFPDGERSPSMGSITVPWCLPNAEHDMQIDLVSNKIPILLSYKEMADLGGVLDARAGTFDTDHGKMEDTQLYLLMFFHRPQCSLLPPLMIDPRRCQIPSP